MKKLSVFRADRSFADVVQAIVDADEDLVTALFSIDRTGEAVAGSSLRCHT